MGWGKAYGNLKREEGHVCDNPKKTVGTTDCFQGELRGNVALCRLGVRSDLDYIYEIERNLPV